jgi:hypothetical protein
MSHIAEPPEACRVVSPLLNKDLLSHEASTPAAGPILVGKN